MPLEQDLEFRLLLGDLSA
jgi:hypothetical protein